MSVCAPRTTLFTKENESINPGLGDGWTYLQAPVVCRPWRVHVFTLRVSDFAGCPSALCDLAVIDASGEQIENATQIGALLGLLTTLPAEVRAHPGKGAPSVTATFQENGRSMQKTQLVLEPLRSPFEPYLIVGLRLHVLLFDHKQAFPFLSSSLWQRVLASNEARRKKEMARAHPPPVSQDPAVASRYLTSMASVAKMWDKVLGDGITGTRSSVKDWAARHNGSVSNVGFAEAVVTLRTLLYCHRLSPEWILRLSPETLRLRAPMETAVDQLSLENYVKADSESYSFPNVTDCLVFAGTDSAFRAPLPVQLANELMRAHEALGNAGAGQSFHGSRLSEGALAGGKRKRGVDLDAESNTDSAASEE